MAGEEGSPAKVDAVCANEIKRDSSEFWGDKLGPRDNYLRVLYNNTNGLQIGDHLVTTAKREVMKKDEKALRAAKSISKVSGIISALDRWDANIMCCAETQTAWKKKFVRDSVERELRKVDRYASLVGSSSATVTAEAYKPGGTMTIVDGNWSNRSKKFVDSHKLGRWSYITIHGRNDTFLTIITAYRCCAGQTSNTVGSYSSYMQQETLLKRNGIRKSPQEAFIVDLIVCINDLISKGHEILLCVDANEAWEGAGSRIKDLARRTGLIDIAAERSEDQVPATYSRMNSARRIDYILTSEGVSAHVMAMGIASKDYDPVLGDHRPQYVDINVKGLLDIGTHDIDSPTSRKLKSTHPKSVDAYVKQLLLNFGEHNIFERVEKLWMELEKRVTMTQIHMVKYEAIDRDIYRLCVNAENCLKSNRHGKYVWSPALDAAVNVVYYWKMRLKHFVNAAETSALIQKGVAKGYCDERELCYSEVKKELKQAYLSLKEVQSKDKEKRVSFLSDLADKYASDNKIDKETAIRELMDHEETRELYRTIRLRMQGCKAPQMSEIWTRDNNGEKVVLTEATEVEEHLLERNWKQLRQASDTPFATGHLGDLLHFDGSGDIAEKIIHGEHFPALDEMNEVIQKYILGMKASDPSILNTVKTDVTLKEYREFWKKKRETTVTSPFGLHIGHYKSALQQEAQEILDVHRIMMIIPFRFAMVPTRWAKTVQIMLEKDSGSPWSHRLRIIELFDSQVNAGLQMIFGKRMVSNALERKELHESAYGSVPMRTAQDAVLEKTLSMDLIRIKKLSGAIFDCDAKGCYDRIIAALQTVTCRRLGVPRTTAMFFARFWRMCHHYVRTRHGTSRDAYFSVGSDLLYGIGQGNGAGPAFWLSNLIIMFMVLDTIWKGMVFSSPSGKITHQSSGMGYVDDVTLGCATKRPSVPNDEIIETSIEEEEEVIREITSMGQTWEQMLFTNGGLLELKKCYWVLIAWKWVKGRAIMKTIEEVPATMKIRQSDRNTVVTIPRKAVEAAPRVLGCHIAANGSWKTEYGKWCSEGARFAHKVKTAKFSRTCGSKVYPSIWLAKLRYISSVVCFNKKEAEKINRPVVFRCLPAAGFNSHFPREVVFGPEKYGGLAWESCWSLQILEKIKFCLRHIRKEDKLGNLLMILIESVQLQSGLIVPILDTRIRWNEWVEPTWLGNVKEGLDAIEGGIITNSKVPRIPRRFDRALMEIFNGWSIKKKEMQTLNRCRIYMQVIFVSDIVDFEGKVIMEEALDVRQTRPSCLAWSRQVRPPLGDRKIWLKYISRLCTIATRLTTQLGQWCELPHQIWPYMVSKNKLTLLRHIGGVQKEMNPVSNSTYEKLGRVITDFKRGYPVVCVPTGVGYKVKHSIYNHIQTGAGDHIDRLKPKNKAMAKTLGHVACRCLHTLESLWSNGSRWKVATDGGLKNNIGTCGVVLWNVHQKKEICSARSAERCDFNLLHSTREELRGNLAAEILMDEMNNRFGDEGVNEIEFICDSKSALKIVGGDISSLKQSGPLEAEMELTLEIGRLRSKNNRHKRDFKWVRSHQDNKNTKDTNEELNDRADQIATECREEAQEGFIPLERKQTYEGSLATLQIRGTVINKDLKKMVQEALYAREMKRYMMNKYGWDENAFNNIDWTVLEMALKKKKGIHRVTIIKLLHFWQPTNRYVQRNERRRQVEARCPECECNDDQMHYMQCRSEYFTEARAYAWKRFCEHMKWYTEEVTLFQIISIGIKHWIYGDFEESLPKGDELSDGEYEALVRAYDHQNLIGWNHFVVGKFSKCWCKYYALRVPESKEKQGKVLAFGQKLVESLWILTLTVWQRHNEAVHGKKGKYSARDEVGIRECIKKIYDLKPLVLPEDEWLFNIGVKIRSEQQVPQMIGWIERVLLCFSDDVRQENEVLTRAKHILYRMCKSTVFS